MVKNRRLVTIKKAVELIGASESFLWDLLKDGILTTYKIKSATYINIEEFYSIAVEVKKQKIGV